MTVHLQENGLIAMIWPLETNSILRRIITKDGRSRCYINGTPSLLSDLKTIGELLIDIHGQHEHQSLLKKSSHKLLLDDFADVGKLAVSVTCLAAEYDKVQMELHSLLSLQQEREERVQLLSYQLKELAQLGLTENETHELEQNYRKLTSATETLTTCHQVNTICSENESGNVLQQLSLCINNLSELSFDHPAITQSIDMLSSAQIQVEEAIGEISRFVDYFDADPQSIQVIEERLSAIYELARKHRIQPDQLLERQQSLADELEELQCHDELSNELGVRLDRLFETYHEQAQKLSEKRQKSALKLEKIISSRMKILGMSKGLFKVAIHQGINKAPSIAGLDDIEFLVTTNPSLPPRPLAKVASGGELSRISLAIQVAISQTSQALTLVFDEVDVGIGGGTAEIVGKMLRGLGEKGQVLCVTHQPQVASRGHHHVHVDKKVTSSQSRTHITLLAGDYRIKEVARMLGGVEITSSTLAHAREMLEG